MFETIIFQVSKIKVARHVQPGKKLRQTCQICLVLRLLTECFIVVGAAMFGAT